MTVSFMTENEKNKYSKIFYEKFGTEGKKKSYENTTLVAILDYLLDNLITWKTNDAHCSIGFNR